MVISQDVEIDGDARANNGELQGTPIRGVEKMKYLNGYALFTDGRARQENVRADGRPATRDDTTGRECARTRAKSCECH